jgi:hypothetical protein
LITTDKVRSPLLFQITIAELTYWKFMKKFFSLLIISALFFLSIKNSFSQVTVTATAGNVGPVVYTTLGAAFTAINAGTHQGAITISITANTNEGSTPVTLNSSGAGSASYTSVLIQPTVDGVTVSGNPASGYGVIQLNGADNVIINGDNPNTGGINRNLTISNTAAANVIACSVVRIATSTAVLSADNNTIKNCNLIGNVTGGNLSGLSGSSTSSNSSFGIFAGGKGGATATGTPTNITSVTNDTASRVTTINNLLIDNNAINQCARGVVFNGATASVSNSITISNNLIGDQLTALTGNPPYTSPSTTVYTKGIWINGTTSIIITGNTLRNIISYIATALSAIELNGAIGSGTINISGNIITGLAQNSTTPNVVRGIYLNSSGGTFNISGNTISNLKMLGSAGIIAIDIAAAPASGSVQNNNIFNIHNRSSNAYLSYGINLNGGNSVAVQNNFISDINMYSGNPVTATASQPVGIRIASGSGHKIYHNSVNLFGAPLGGSAANGTSCLMIVNSNSTGIDIRNNIFSNQFSGWPSGSVHACIMFPSGLTSAFNLILNNNAYFAGSENFLAQLTSGTTYTITAFNPNSTSGSANWRNYSSGLLGANTNNDNASFGASGPAPFISSTNLHIPAGTTTTLESTGASVTGGASDIDGDIRPGPQGSIHGGGYANDIGADEFDGTPSVDIIPPVINYSILPDNDSSICRNFSGVCITDALSGVNTQPETKPRCYFKKLSDANTYAGNTSADNGWKWTSANGSTSPFDFTLDYSLLYGGCGITRGDIVQYFVIAQDLSPVPNIAISSGTLASVPSSVNLDQFDFPITGAINQYFIANPLPVFLSFFTGYIRTRDIILQWQTTSELNNKGFNIERRTMNDVTLNTYSPWEEIVFIQGHGTTWQPQAYSYVDAKLSSGKYQYRLKQIDYNGGSVYYNLENPGMVEIGKPIKPDVSQNYPNPSNPKSKIDYQIPFDGKVSIKVYDIIGKGVAVLVNEVKESGFYTIEFDGSNLSSGVYFYRVIAEGNGLKFTQTKKMILVK